MAVRAGPVNNNGSFGRREEERKKELAAYQAAYEAVQAQAKERERLALLQQQQLQQMNLASAAQAAEQQRTVQGLQAQQAARVQQIGAIGNAVAASLRILAAPQSTAPTAAVAPTQKKKRGAPTAASSLRMGATASGRGAGTNLAI